MQGLISIEEFVAHLREEGLVLVPGKELVALKEAKLQALRAKYMKRRALTFKEVLEAELLPVSSKNGIEGWIERGKIKEGEVVKGKVRMLLTSAIRRLGYED